MHLFMQICSLSLAKYYNFISAIFQTYIFNKQFCRIFRRRRRIFMFITESGMQHGFPKKEIRAYETYETGNSGRGRADFGGDAAGNSAAGRLRGGLFRGGDGKIRGGLYRQGPETLRRQPEKGRRGGGRGLRRRRCANQIQKQRRLFLQGGGADGRGRNRQKRLCQRFRREGLRKAGSKRTATDFTCTKGI